MLIPLQLILNTRRITWCQQRQGRDSGDGSGGGGDADDADNDSHHDSDGGSDDICECDEDSGHDGNAGNINYRGYDGNVDDDDRVQCIKLL